MKSNILHFIILIFLSSCNQNKLEGRFIYTEVAKEKTKDEIFFGLGNELVKEITCSSIGVITFKNGKCYYSVSFLGLKQDMKVDYHIDDKIIYVNSNVFNQSGVGLFELIDDNTITYQGCIFKRIDWSKYKEAKTTSKVNMRVGPSTNHEIYFSLEKDSDIFLIERYGEWYKVRAGWKEGFVHQDFIKLE
jgi:hypothetical protein